MEQRTQIGHMYCVGVRLVLVSDRSSYSCAVAEMAPFNCDDIPPRKRRWFAGLVRSRQCRWPRPFDVALHCLLPCPLNDAASPLCLFSPRHVRAVELRGGGGGHTLDPSPSLGGGGVRGRRRGDSGEGVAGAGAPQAAHGPVCAPPECRVQWPQRTATAQGLHPAAGKWRRFDVHGGKGNITRKIRI